MGHDVRPRPGSDGAGGLIDVNHVLTAPVGEASEAVEHLEIGRGDTRRIGLIARRRPGERHVRRPLGQRVEGRLKMSQLLLQISASAVDHHAGGGLQERLLLVGHQVRPQQEDTARPVHPGLFRTALDDLAQRIGELLPIARAVHVQHDEIEGEALFPADTRAP